jgi:hypothetical protein
MVYPQACKPASKCNSLYPSLEASVKMLHYSCRARYARDRTKEKSPRHIFIMLHTVTAAVKITTDGLFFWG